jgi:hypothetical protein
MAGAYAMWGSAATYETGDPLPEMKRSRTPGFLKQLAETMESVPYWEAEPVNDIVAPDPEMVEGVPYRCNFALGKPGSFYVLYSRKAGRVHVTLPAGRYKATATQFAPLAPASPGPARVDTESAITVESGQHSFDLRISYDWAIVIRRKN